MKNVLNNLQKSILQGQVHRTQRINVVVWTVEETIIKCTKVQEIVTECAHGSLYLVDPFLQHQSAHLRSQR